MRKGAGITTIAIVVLAIIVLALIVMFISQFGTRPELVKVEVS